jgi:hypothetical protein
MSIRVRYHGEQTRKPLSALCCPILGLCSDCGKQQVDIDCAASKMAMLRFFQIHQTASIACNEVPFRAALGTTDPPVHKGVPRPGDGAMDRIQEHPAQKDTHKRTAREELLGLVTENAAGSMLVAPLCKPV